MKSSFVLVVAAAMLMAPLTLQGQQSVPYKSGWPQDTGLLVDRSSPAVGNLDDDADLEIVVGTVGKKVYAFNPNGTLVPGWPVTVTGEVNSSPAIGDIDGDGFNEVVVGVGWQDLTNDGAIYAFRRNGQVMAGWPFVTKDLNLGPNGHPDGVFATPALVDLDLDGRLDIVVGGFDQYLYALRYNAQPVAGAWPFFLYDSTWSSAAVGDLDRDGEPEIVIGAYTHAGFPPGLTTVDGGGIMWVLSRTGAVKPGWPRVFDLHIDSSPALGDLDGDGDLEIVVGTGQEVGATVGRKVYAMHHDGTNVANWPVSTGAYVWPSPALADLDGNGRPEVIISGEDGRLRVWKPDGTPLAGWPVQPLNESGVNGGMSGSPVAVDLNGDGSPEVLVPIGWDIVGFSGNGSFFKYGAEAQLRLHTYFSVGGTPTVADIDGNGRLDVMIGSANSSFSAGRLFVWELPAAAIPGVSPWPMFRRGPERTGLLSPSSPLSSSFFTLTPCRVFDTRETTGPAAGSPALAAGSRRVFPMAGKCGIPSDAKALSINVTVTQAGAAGDVKITPGDQLTTVSSTLSFGVGRTRASVTLMRLSTDGAGTIAATNTAPAAVHLIVDVNGYFR
ncbi:MAG: VCBS repeat-containing protein [Holophagales bacterium]|nr:VCBS repeat-containing protein [Holophagales bacterium]